MQFLSHFRLWDWRHSKWLCGNHGQTKLLEQRRWDAAGKVRWTFYIERMGKGWGWQEIPLGLGDPDHQQHWDRHCFFHHGWKCDQERVEAWMGWAEMDKTFLKCAQSLLCSGMLSWPEGEEKTTSTEESQGSIPEDLSAGELYTDVTLLFSPL